VDHPVAYFHFLLNSGLGGCGKAAAAKRKGAPEMPKYLYAYHGGGSMAGQSKAEQDKVMQAWIGWFGQLGSAVVDGGNPVGMSKTVLPSGKVENNGGANPAAGYTIVEAKDIDDAVAKAKDCPILMDPAFSVEIAPIIEVM
jgi:hypothetical protein